jgi:hypothetical protein
MSEEFLVLWKTKRDMINKTYIGLHLKCPLFLSYFNQTWIFSTDFRKISELLVCWGEWVEGLKYTQIKNYNRIFICVYFRPTTQSPQNTSNSEGTQMLPDDGI